MLRSNSFTVGITPTLIITAESSPVLLNIHSDSNIDVFLGGSDVTLTTGYHMRKEDVLNMSLHSGGSLYAISAVPTSIIVMSQQL